MKSIHTTLANAVALIVLASASSLAAAAGSQTLAVTASVTGLCKFSAASTPLAFGAIDPSSGANATVSANVIYKCTKGTASAGVTATGGLARTMTGGANTLAYTLSFAGATQTGGGFSAAPANNLTLVVTGTITPAQFADAAAVAYSENVTLNITP